MTREDRQLLIAGLAAVVSLVLAAVALTITVIVIAQPPVYDHVSAETNAEFASRRRWDWIGPVLNVIVPLFVVAQVALRRPILISPSRARRIPTVSMAQIIGFLVLGVVVLLLAGRVIAMEVASLVSDKGRPLTDNPSFAGLRISIGLLAFVPAMLSLMLFTRWWQQRDRAGLVVPDQLTGL